MKVFTSAAAAIIMIAGLVTVGHGATRMSGAEMYAARCEVCHGKIAETSIIRGATSTMMEFAIKSNFGGMKQFSGLNSNNLQDISAAIATSGLSTQLAGGSSNHLIPSSLIYTSSGAAQAAEVQAVPEKSAPAAAPVAPSGAEVPVATAGGGALYGSNCAGCHGPASSSSKKGASYARIQAAIKGNAGGMGSLSSLSGTDLQAIADALGGGAAVAAVASAGVPALEPATPAVSAPFAAAPVTFNVAPDGGSLYASNCAFCHGPMSSTSKRGATFARIQTAISLNSGGMSSLANMQPTDLLAIAAALGNNMTIVQLPASTTSSAATGVTGSSSLYDSNCASCHGPLASSSKKGVSASMIQSAISANTGGMGSLSSLSATDIQTIATALGSGGSSPAPAMASKPAASKPATASKKKATAAKPATLSAPAAATPGATSGGATLYDSSCASCHGPLASSTKKGAGAATIQGAISANTGGMGSLSSLSAADIQSIADALAGSGGAAGGSGGAGGMSGNCISCHPNGPPPGTMGGGKGGEKNSEGKAKGNGGGSKGGEGRGGERRGGGEGRGGGDD